MKKLLIAIAGVILLVALAGMYKFNYLSSQEGYDVDGNKIEIVDEVEAAVCGEDGNRYANNQAALDAGLDYSRFGATYCPEYKTIIHPTWDTDEDGLIDCGVEAPCDLLTTDYSQPKK